MNLLLINGPLGSGKSWTTLRLQEAYPHVQWNQISFKGPIAIAAQTLLNANHIQYEAFKTQSFFGATGREWMILIGTMARNQYVNIFAEIAIDKAVQMARSNLRQIFFCDDLGFPNELQVPRVREGVNVLAASIEPHGGVLRGEQYVGDSRFNLAGSCNLVASESGDLLPKICKSLENRGWV